MKITRRTAQKLIKAGKASEEGLMSTGDFYPQGTVMVILNRHDLMRTDHYEATDADIGRLEAAAA